MGLEKAEKVWKMSYVLREIIERSRRQGRGLYMVFIDTENAYDTVDKRRLLQLLEHIDVEDKIVKTRKFLQTEQK